MDPLESNLPGGPYAGQSSLRAPARKSRRWLWLIVFAVVAAIGFWYFRGSKASTEAQGPGRPAEAKVRGGKAPARADSWFQWSLPRRSAATFPFISMGSAR